MFYRGSNLTCNYSNEIKRINFCVVYFADFAFFAKYNQHELLQNFSCTRNISIPIIREK